MTTPNNWQSGQPGGDNGSSQPWGHGAEGQPDRSFGTPEASPYGSGFQGQAEGSGFGQAPQYGQDQPYSQASQYGQDQQSYGQGQQAYGQGQPSYGQGQQSYGQTQDPYGQSNATAQYGAPYQQSGYSSPGFDVASGFSGSSSTPPQKKGGMPIWGWALTAVAVVAILGLGLAFLLPAVFGNNTADPTANPTTSQTGGTDPTSSPSASTSASPSSSSSASPTQAANGTYVDLNQRTTPTSVTMSFTGTGRGYGSATPSTVDNGKVDRYRSDDGKCTASVWTFHSDGGYSQTDGEMTDNRFELDTETQATSLEAPTDYDFIATDGTTYQMKQYKIKYKDNNKSEEANVSRTFSGLGTEVIFSLTCNPGTLTQDRITEARGMVTLEVK